MTNNNYYEDRTLNLPENCNLPFFAYGIFKPGQLAYSKIKKLVLNSTNNIKIPYEMRIRDGIPILTNKKGDHYYTKGSIMKFKEGNEINAYAIISKTLLKTQYEWKTIRINEIEHNILFGLDTKGSDHIEGREERVNFDGRNDPFFKEAIILIETNLKSKKDYRINSFFELQMNYMLLWSAIDRYTGLKYNKRLKKWNNEKFANEKAFREGIKRYENNYHQPVYSTEDVKIHEFNVENPYETLLYYYTLRCNVVHRGKAIFNDFSMLEKATEELLEIFKDILKDTFGET